LAQNPLLLLIVQMRLWQVILAQISAFMVLMVLLLTSFPTRLFSERHHASILGLSL